MDAEITFFFFFLNERSSSYSKVAKLLLTPLQQEFNHRLETIAFNLQNQYASRKNDQLNQIMKFAFHQLPKTSLDVQSPPESSFRMRTVSNILCCSEVQIKDQKRIILLLPTSFSRLGSAKINENPQKSSDLLHHGLHSERHTLQNVHNRPRRVCKSTAVVATPQRTG